MADLVDFLRARLDEDEQVARAASPGPWKPNAEHDVVVAVDDITVADGFALSNRQLRATVDHIVRHDPARVLAEVAAKRRIIAEVASWRHEAVVDVGGGFYSCDEGDDCRCGVTERQQSILHPMTLPDAGHPDYCSEWTP